MRSTEGVVDVNITQPTDGLRERRIVRLFAFPESDVFDEQHLPCLQRVRLSQRIITRSVVHVVDGRCE